MYAHQSSYASFNNQYSDAYLGIADELYQAGRAWGSAGNTRPPKCFPLDRGDGTVTMVPIVGAISFNASEFVRGWKETRPAMPAAKKGNR
jgi:hypothetical protein